MAHVTVEDCVDKVTNRFDLVFVAERKRGVNSAYTLFFLVRWSNPPIANADKTNVR